eukprot:TRINITY_DN4055_c0_g1_i3.p1 TRINITY_DN4055_c0_g1~~TRINITY_DN4055_c0_g1_i3.p1  ORF type:complete len:204 (+),score=23.86 TRINITY_DN4055_c0_g1_i3:214-825(+)
MWPQRGTGSSSSGPSGPSPSSSGPDPSLITISGIQYAGTGCPAGSVAQVIDPSRTVFTLIFDRFIAQDGPNVDYSETTKNCQINVDLRVPQGWQYSIVSVDYRGYAKLDPSAVGIHQTLYYWAGNDQTALSREVINGPIEENYQIRHQFGLESLIWSECNAVRSLNINARISVTAEGNDRGLITNDSVDGKFRQIQRLMWKRC